jgi:hypothetical protein
MLAILLRKDRAREERTDEDGLRQIEDNRGEHGHDESDHVGFEAFAEDETNRLPLVHADGGHHQHARQRRQRDSSHERRKQEHGQQQSNRVDDADEARLSARFDSHAGARDRRRGGDSAEEWDEHVAHALRDQFLIRLQAHTRHVRADRAAQQRFHCAERGDGQDRREEVGEIRPRDVGEAEAVGEEKRLGDVADGSGGPVQSRGEKRGEDDAEERGGEARCPFFRP